MLFVSRDDDHHAAGSPASWLLHALRIYV